MTHFIIPCFLATSQTCMAASRVASRQRMLDGIGRRGSRKKGEGEEAVAAAGQRPRARTMEALDWATSAATAVQAAVAAVVAVADVVAVTAAVVEAAAATTTSVAQIPSPYLLAVAALRSARGIGRNDKDTEEGELHLLLVLCLCSVRVFARGEEVAVGVGG